MSNRLFALVLALLCHTGNVNAHRGHGAWSEVTRVDQGFEIVHRMHLADAIELLRGMAPGVKVESIEGQARLALYVEARFQIIDAGGTLETIGAEIEDDFLLVYQEWRITDLPATTPMFSSRVLFEIDPTAQRFVRYDDGTQVVTVQLPLP